MKGAVSASASSGAAAKDMEEEENVAVAAVAVIGVVGLDRENSNWKPGLDMLDDDIVLPL